jgi:hypothetical protein
LHSAIGNYPSNADIWWQFKNTSNVFAPTTSSILNVTLPNTQAPSGHYILNAFNQDRTSVSGISGLTAVSTTMRPTTGAWFAGRAWYTGTNDSLQATTDQSFYSWTESIYYSKVVQHQGDVGLCYSENDPTDETFFDPLPTDGGVIVIQGTGPIYKLFPVANGLLVMAANGIWLISGSSGYGFDSTSYLISKISSVKLISGSSVVDILGFPAFWNLEGIYAVSTGKENNPYGQGGLTVNPITVGTIQTFYDAIPHQSKLYAKGAYDPIGYVVQWVYRTTAETDINNRYFMDGILNFNTYNKAFYPYEVATTETSTVAERNIAGIVYVSYPSNPQSLIPQFKYPSLNTITNTVKFSEENNFTDYLDWIQSSTNGLGVDYISTFTTGYKLHGQAYRKWQPIYVYVYLNNENPSSYTIESIWDYNDTALGRTSQAQTIVNFDPYFKGLFRRHKLRGHGLVVQFKFSSVTGEPFSIWGWSVPEQGALGS